MWSGSFWVSVRFWYYKTINEAETLQKGKWAFFFFPSSIPFCGKKFYVSEEPSFPLVFSYLGHLKLEWPQLEVWCPWNRRLLLCAGMAQETFGPDASLGLIGVCVVVLFLQRRLTKEEGFVMIRSISAALGSLECVCSLLQHSWGHDSVIQSERWGFSHRLGRDVNFFSPPQQSIAMM